MVAIALTATALTGCSSDADRADAPGTTRAGGEVIATSTVPPSPPSSVPAPAGAVAAQPPQPTAGPGGSALPHGDWRVSSGGTGPDAWYVFEPADPAPRTAPVAVVLHGYFEYEGYGTMHELVRHTVRSGTIVVYPRWQTDLATPCPGPLDVEPCIRSAAAGIEGALAHLRDDPERVQPDLERVSYFGHSFGGIIAVNLVNRHRELGLAPPQAVFLDEPHDGGLDGPGEPALDRPLDGIPEDVLLQCHVGATGTTSEPGKAGSSCNALFPLLDHVPDANKDLLMTRDDEHGEPALRSWHGVCSSPEGRADAYDWNFCWRAWDALRAAAHDGQHRDVALGDSATRRSNGEWSDGTPVAPLEVRDAAPIRP